MSIFVIPMVGLSSRFFNAGYSVPKYQLPIQDKTMFEWAVQSFKQYYHSDHFLFIIRDAYESEKFVHSQIEQIGIINYHIVVLDEMTSGQAETVYLGLRNTSLSSDEDLFIFNIDSHLHHFNKPKWLPDCDGYLEVFKGEGNHWSFVKLDQSQQYVSQTTEKDRISDLCSDGLYYFKSIDLFNESYQDAVDNQKYTKGELYIAPLYNYLINKGYKIRIDCIDKTQISICGTPAEYENYIKEE